MPQGKGTYGKKVGRPPKKNSALTIKDAKKKKKKKSTNRGLMGTGYGVGP
tara:strand:+ start:83 stop:232 length:150 start_codon:yes stop_codon:yes gene_type:complete